MPAENVSNLPTIVALISAIAAILAWRETRQIARRDLQTIVEDLRDSLIEQVDEIREINTYRWTLRQSMLEIAGRIGSGLEERERDKWEKQSQKLRDAIDELHKQPEYFTNLGPQKLTQFRRTLMSIKRRFDSERLALEKCSEDNDRTWNRKIDLQNQYK
ncbi:MAG: hypothetical protein R3C58_03215 [Parvularculaceae bacterium]